jgi:hypothetical protein
VYLVLIVFQKQVMMMTSRLRSNSDGFESDVTSMYYGMPFGPAGAQDPDKRVPPSGPCWRRSQRGDVLRYYIVTFRENERTLSL